MAKFLRWLTILRVRYEFFRFDIETTDDNRRRWRNYIRCGDARRDV